METKDGKVEFGAGDFVTFPAGLSCVWVGQQPKRKEILCAVAIKLIKVIFALLRDKRNFEDEIHAVVMHA